MNKALLLLLLCALSMLSIARAEIPQPLVDAQWLAENQASVVILDSLRIDMDDSLILHCNSAYECASVWFVLHEILGKQDGQSLRRLVAPVDAVRIQSNDHASERLISRDGILGPKTVVIARSEASRDGIWIPACAGMTVFFLDW